ncbi:hypothetical protein AB835_05065 [Candidatus Endobugula sertula]|uniref:Peptidase S54 rhomboid domain-containing protein n=1 Tax=Candidatus Endobugula sertula TaxID=62101 RepID=A0A1D2QR85_9GAMM|nr:hypothetical protein AB835_05065 [Candidatus Endobugula sertula]
MLNDIKASKSRFYSATCFLCFIWGVSILGLVGLLPDVFPKLLPRHVSGILGILTMPLLHGSLIHLMSNTLPFIIFSLLISLRGNSYYIKVSVLILLITGALLWLFGRSSFHIGASGLVFGYFGFLLVRMFYSPSISTIAISLGVFIIYGGMIWGVLPQRSYVSWEGHLFGMIAGVIVAKAMGTKKN